MYSVHTHLNLLMRNLDFSHALQSDDGKYSFKSFLKCWFSLDNTGLNQILRNLAHKTCLVGLKAPMMEESSKSRRFCGQRCFGSVSFLQNAWMINLPPSFIMKAQLTTQTGSYRRLATGRNQEIKLLMTCGKKQLVTCSTN